MTSKVYAAAAKACITPPKEMMPAESFLPIRLTKVYRDIFVRVLAIKSEERIFLLTVFESGDMSRREEIQNILEHRFGLDPKFMIFAVTHTHEAPSFASDHNDIRKDPGKLKWVQEYGDFVIARTIECVKDALSRLEPVFWGWNTGKSYINVNRDQQYEDGTWDIGTDFAAPSDKTADIIKFVGMDGHLVAVIANYAVHGTACFFGKDESGENFMISGDIPGMTSSYIEKRFEKDDAVCLWTSGAAGNQAPLFMPQLARFNHDGSHDADGFNTGYACWSICEYLAERHAVDLIGIMNQAVCDKTSMRIHSFERVLDLPGIKKSEEIRPDNVTMHLQLVTLDDLALFGIGAEIVTEIGQRLKEASPMKNLIIIEHTAERIDYVPDKLGFERKTFEGLNTRIKDGFGEQFIQHAMIDMMEENQKIE